MNDKEIEKLLHDMPLSRPTAGMDWRVMSLRRSGSVPVLLGAGSLAAAAAVLLALALHWGQTTAVITPNRPVVQAPNPAAETLRPVRFEETVQVISDEVKEQPGKPPVREIRQTNTQKITWVDKVNGIHIETVGEPHEEVIVVQQGVN